MPVKKLLETISSQFAVSSRNEIIGCNHQLPLKLMHSLKWRGPFWVGLCGVNSCKWKDLVLWRRIQLKTFEKLISFCSAIIPLASTRWVRMTLSLSAVLSGAVNKSQQLQEKNSRECWELNPGLLSKKQICYFCAMQPPSIFSFCVNRTQSQGTELNF